MRHLLLLTLLLTLLGSGCQSDTPEVLIETDYGNIRVMLYDSTPRHRDNFIKLISEGYYDSLLFHRVIPGFMIQGGDPNSKYAPAHMSLGTGGPTYVLDSEIGIPHFRGTLAAARTPNPAKQSSGSQFYLVQGRPIEEEILRQLERSKGYQYNDAQRQLYQEIGGAPELDNDYTVFGEIVSGLEVLDEIARVPTGANDRPVKDVRMRIRLLK